MSTTLKLAGLALGSLASWPRFGLLDICGHGGRCQRRMPRVSGVACGWKTPWRPAAGGTVGRDLPLCRSSVHAFGNCSGQGLQTLRMARVKTALGLAPVNISPQGCELDL